MGDVARTTGIGNGLDQAVNQANELIDDAQHQCSQVRGTHFTGEVSPNGEAPAGGKRNCSGVKSNHGQVPVDIFTN